MPYILNLKLLKGIYRRKGHNGADDLPSEEPSEITGRSPSAGLPANLGDNLSKAQDKLPGIIQSSALRIFKSLGTKLKRTLNLNALYCSTQMGSTPLSKTKGGFPWVYLERLLMPPILPALFWFSPSCQTHILLLCKWKESRERS